MGEELENVAMRLPMSVLVDVDAHILFLRTATPWAKVGRSDALRDLVMRGLQSLHHFSTAQLPRIPGPEPQLPLPPEAVPPPALLPAPETPPAPAPMAPVGMKPCSKGHAPYPMGKNECPACAAERMRANRQRKAKEKAGAQP